MGYLQPIGFPVGAIAQHLLPAMVDAALEPFADPLGDADGSPVFRAEAGAHEQMREVWRELGAFVQARRVDTNLIKILRVYMVHHWRVPAKRSPFTEGWDGSIDLGLAAIQPVAALMQQARPLASPTPLPPVTPKLAKPLELGEGGLRETVEDTERRLISVALDQCGGPDS